MNKKSRWDREKKKETREKRESESWGEKER